MLNLSISVDDPERTLAGQRGVNRPAGAPPPGCHGLGARARGVYVDTAARPS
jgi:hypothetical protein